MLLVLISCLLNSRTWRLNIKYKCTLTHIKHPCMATETAMYLIGKTSIRCVVHPCYHGHIIIGCGLCYFLCNIRIEEINLKIHVAVIDYN